MENFLNFRMILNAGGKFFPLPVLELPIIFFTTSARPFSQTPHKIPTALHNAIILFIAEHTMYPMMCSSMKF